MPHEHCQHAADSFAGNQMKLWKLIQFSLKFASEHNGIINKIESTLNTASLFC